MTNLQPLDSGWHTKPASQVTDSGTAISKPTYPATGWIPAIVPGTILNTLLKNDPAFPTKDPYFGTDNNEIPEISDSKHGVAFYTYWFRTTFNLPDTSTGTRFWLDLRGINYTAHLYLNGQAVDVGYQKPPINTVTGQPLVRNEIQGMFLRQFIDVTSLAKPGAENVLAIRVEPPNPPGVPNGNGGHLDETNIAKNVTMRYTVGWDWIVPVRDRNTGIWDRIAVCSTGPVRIRHPHVVTRILNEKGELASEATVTLSADVHNASKTPVTGTLSYRVPDNGLQGSQQVTIGAGDIETISFPPLTIKNPRLWWPRGHGDPELYTLIFKFEAGGLESDSRQLRFGIREITVACSDVPKSPSNFTFKKSRRFSVNGQPIFLRGATWIGTDAMLRPEYLTDRRYRDEMRMFAEMNLNLIRVWGSGITERPAFYEACDELGLLVMQEFWISSEYNDNYPAGYDELFLNCARDTIYMLRNHPSLCFWSAGNEAKPPPKILQGLQSLITAQTTNGAACCCAGHAEPGPAATSGALDPTRILVPMSTSIGNDCEKHREGPYGIVDPQDFFGPPYIFKDMPQFLNPFPPEAGSVGTPVAETLRRMMAPSDYNEIPTVTGRVPPPHCDINTTWCLHDYIPYIEHFGKNLMSPFGYPTNPDRFCYLAQLLNYEQYQALFEGYTTGMWTKFTGVMVWKGQNPWLGLRGQFYDWLLDQTGGLYGTRHACEPIHIQFNRNDATFLVVNTTKAALRDVTGTADLIDLNGKLLDRTTHTYNSVPQHGLSTRVPVNAPKNLPAVYLLHLELKNSQGALLSKNRYWLSGASPADFSALNNLAAINLQGSVVVKRKGPQYLLKATLTNPGKVVAFFLQLQTRRKRPIDEKRMGSTYDDYRILPTYYEDNYFTLLPGETRTLTADCPVAAAGAQPPELWVQGYNVAWQQIS